METKNRFKNSPLHDKHAILELLDKLNPEQMIKVVDLLQEQVKVFEDSDSTCSCKSCKCG